MLSGDNSILQKATDAKTKTDEAQIRERIRLAYNSALTKDITNQNGEVQKSTLEDELENEFPDKTIEIADSADKKEWIVTIDGVTENVPIGKDTSEEPKTTLKVAEHKNEKFSSNTELEDDYGNKITVPKGFKIIETSPDIVTEGIIIEDATYTNTIGSQFVWIPVGDVYTNGAQTASKTITLGRYEFYPSGVPTEYGVFTVASVKGFISTMPPDQTMVDGMLGTGAYNELSALVGKEDSEIQAWIDAGGSVEQAVENMMLDSANIEDPTYKEGSKDDNINATAKELSTFKSSVSSKGGFYIGRYEARTETQRTYYTSNDYTITDSNLTQITEKQSDYVYNWVTQLQAAKLSREMYSKDNDNNSITEFASDLMNSYAWDTATLFLQECGEERYSIKSSVNTSSDGLAEKGTLTDHPCNVYDMASNCYEWTTETSSKDDYPFVSRGGGYNDSYYYTSSRNSTGSSIAYHSFRPVLYLK